MHSGQSAPQLPFGRTYQVYFGFLSDKPTRLPQTPFGVTYLVAGLAVITTALVTWDIFSILYLLANVKTTGLSW